MNTPAFTRPRILLSLPSLGGGGAERVMLILARTLDRERFAPTVLLGVRSGPLAADLPDDIPVIELGAKRARHATARMAREVLRIRPHAHIATLGFVYSAAACAPLLGGRGVTFARLGNSLGPSFADLARVEPARARIAKVALGGALRMVDRVIVQSDSMRRDTLQTMGRGLAPRLSRIHNPVDVARVRRLAEAQVGREGDRAAAPGTVRCITLGRFAWQKGYDLMLDALAGLVSEGVRFRVDMYGEGPDEEALRAQVVRLGLEGHVFMWPFVRNPYPLLREADLMLLPSRYEGFSNVLLEALLLGTPSVASDGPGGAQEVLTPGVDGEIFRGEDVDALRAALRTAFGRVARREYRDSGDAIAERFGVGAMTAAYEALVLEELAGCGRLRGGVIDRR